MTASARKKAFTGTLVVLEGNAHMHTATHLELASTCTECNHGYIGVSATLNKGVEHWCRAQSCHVMYHDVLRRFFTFAELGWAWPMHDASGPGATSLTPVV